MLPIASCRARFCAHSGGLLRRLKEQCTKYRDGEVPDGVLHTLQKISDLRGVLGNGKDQGIVTPPFEGGVYVSATARKCRSCNSKSPCSTTVVAAAGLAAYLLLSSG